MNKYIITVVVMSSHVTESLFTDVPHLAELSINRYVLYT